MPDLISIPPDSTTTAWTSTQLLSHVLLPTSAQAGALTLSERLAVGRYVSRSCSSPWLTQQLIEGGLSAALLAIYVAPTLWGLDTNSRSAGTECTEDKNLTSLKS
jgi:hypothetical protein